MKFRNPTRLLLAAVTLLAGVLTTADARQARVKLATLAPKGTSFHQILQEMGQTWREAPDGGVRLTIFTDGTMGGEGDVVRRMGLGQLQAALLTTSGLTEIDERVSGLQNIPVAYQSYAEVDYVRDRLGPKYAEMLREKGFVVLGWFDTGWVKIFSKEKITRPDDMMGGKVFIVPGSPGTMEIARSIGTQPVELEPTDVLVSLQTGLVNIAPAPPIYALAAQFFQPAPYMLDVNWLPLSGAIVMSTKSWDRLTAAQKEVMQSSAAEACDRLTARARAEMQDSIDAMVKRGLEVQTVEGELFEEWMDFGVGLHPQIRGGVVPAEEFDEIMGLLEAYRASQANGGD
jgi:TRAP-type transport system periplasmic protein